MIRKSPQNKLTVSDLLAVTLGDGKSVNGTLWLHPSRRGEFEVEYKGIRKTDGRTDYTSEKHLKSMARRILTELAQGE